MDVWRLSGFPCKGRFRYANLNLPSNMIANCAFAMAHSRGGILHSFWARFNTRKRSFSALSSVGKWPRARTALRNLAFNELDCVCRIDDPTHFVGKGVERDDLAPMASPGLGDCRVFSAPWAFGEGVQFFLSGGGVLGPVDLLQRRCDSLAVLVGNEVQRIADQVNDAGLDLGLWKHRGDRLRKALQAIDDGDQDVFEPRFFSSFMTRSQNFAPSVCSIHRPRISLVPSGRTPRAT